MPNGCDICGDKYCFSEPYSCNFLKFVIENDSFNTQYFGLSSKCKRLGNGSYGIAYKLNSKYAIKITTSKYEYDIAKKLVGKKIKNVASIYDVAKVRRKELYIIKTDLLKKLPKPIRNTIDNFVDDYFFLGEYVKAKNKYQKQVCSALTALRSINIENHDLHSGNIMLTVKTNQIRLIDIM